MYKHKKVWGGTSSLRSGWRGDRPTSLARGWSLARGLGLMIGFGFLGHFFLWFDSNSLDGK